MKKAKINEAFSQLNKILSDQLIIGEIGVVGGAAMVLAFDARAATKDVDAIFKPSREIREAARIVGLKLGVPADWLNDAVKGFLPANPEKNTILKMSHLTVWVPNAEYLLAMKAMSARYDSRDADDVHLLIRHLKIKTPAKVLKIVSKYYPKEIIPPKTQFFIEELFENTL